MSTAIARQQRALLREAREAAQRGDAAGAHAKLEEAAAAFPVTAAQRASVQRAISKKPK